MISPESLKAAVCVQKCRSKARIGKGDTEIVFPRLSPCLIKHLICVFIAVEDTPDESPFFGSYSLNPIVDTAFCTRVSADLYLGGIDMMSIRLSLRLNRLKYLISVSSPSQTIYTTGFLLTPFLAFLLISLCLAISALLKNEWNGAETPLQVSLPYILTLTRGEVSQGEDTTLHGLFILLCKPDFITSQKFQVKQFHIVSRADQLGMRPVHPGSWNISMRCHVRSGCRLEQSSSTRTIPHFSSASSQTPICVKYFFVPSDSLSNGSL